MAGKFSDENSAIAAGRLSFALAGEKAPFHPLGMANTRKTRGINGGTNPVTPFSLTGDGISETRQSPDDLQFTFIVPEPASHATPPYRITLFLDPKKIKSLVVSPNSYSAYNVTLPADQLDELVEMKSQIPPPFGLAAKSNGGWLHSCERDRSIFERSADGTLLRVIPSTPTVTLGTSRA